MRIGSLLARLVALVAVAVASGSLIAQTSRGEGYQPPQFYPAGGNAGAPTRPIQALFLKPVGMSQPSSYSDSYGNSAVVPASYCGDDCGDGYGQGGYPMDDAGCCGQCNGGCYGPSDGGYYGDGGGCGYGGYGRGCGHVYGACDDGCAPGTSPPYCDGAENYSLIPPWRTEQCGPHYWDARLEAVFLTRDDAFNQQVDFTSLNVNGPIVLSSSQLDFDYEPGFRVMGRYDIGPLTVLEFGYTGVENLDSSASFTDPDPVNDQTGNLYSLFTNFVRDPAAVPADVTSPGGSFPATERGITQSITLESELHVAEMNCRRYWVGFSPCVSGTMLAGFRFTRLREDFDFTSVGEARGQYLELVKNDMAGFQTGGDMWVRLHRGLRAGVEGKVALLNNHYTLDNSFSSTDVAQAGVFSESFEKDIPSFISEGSADIVCDVLPSWSIRAGYEFMFLNSVVLAGENFNTGSIYSGETDVLLPPRVPFVWDQGHAFYHGFHAGAEFTW